MKGERNFKLCSQKKKKEEKECGKEIQSGTRKRGKKEISKNKKKKNLPFKSFSRSAHGLTPVICHVR